MSDGKSDDIPIPEFIHDSRSGTKYRKGKFYGKGGFAKCYELIDPSGHIYAGKIVSKKLLVKSNQKEKMAQEISIHRSLKHRHVVGFHGNFEDDHFVYVLLELCHKRSMMELHKRRKALTEPETRYYMKQILEGVLYLHEKGIIHRDLKLGNLFLNDGIEVKIGDFGLAATIEYEGQRKKTLCGTPNYIAPEILNKKGHSFEVDVWSIGCIMYTLLVGKPPFETTSLKETYERIKQCNYRLPSSMPKSAANLIHKMLQPEPKRRPTVKEILFSDFFTSGYIPPQLPQSCLVTVPRFDHVMREQPGGIITRKPLAEVNNGGDSPIIQNSMRNAVKAYHGVINGQITEKPIVKVTQTCRDYLTQLHKLMVQTLKIKPPLKAIVNLEEMSDPAAQPMLWISKWVDYSDKYGFGYQLCDDGVGVMFNDNTRILLLANQKNVHYIDREGSEHYYTVDTIPTDLDKKSKLLSYFKRYMKEHLMKAGSSVPIKESDQLSRIPYLFQWHRSNSAVIMQLTNGSLQINFMDHSKIIVCPLMAAVTFIDHEKNFRTFRFETIAQYGCSNDLQVCLEYATKKVETLLSS